MRVDCGVGGGMCGGSVRERVERKGLGVGDVLPGVIRGY